MPTQCLHCSYENPLGANFCSSCGGSLEVPASSTVTQLLDIAKPAEQVAPIPAPKQAMLVVRQGIKRGSQIALDRDHTTIGRHPESDIFLDDVTVSRRHAEIRRSGGGFVVADAGSLNGTYVDKERVERKELHHGSELQVGKFKLAFISLEDEE